MTTEAIVFVARRDVPLRQHRVSNWHAASYDRPARFGVRAASKKNDMVAQTPQISACNHSTYLVKTARVTELS